jgi:methylglyoxal synthase
MKGMIALIAHDGTKDEMLALAEEFRDQLEAEAVVATATTGGISAASSSWTFAACSRARSEAISRSARWSRAAL